MFAPLTYLHFQILCLFMIEMRDAFISRRSMIFIAKIYLSDAILYAQTPFLCSRTMPDARFDAA